MVMLIILVAVPLYIKIGLKPDNTLPQLSQLLTLQNNQEVVLPLFLSMWERKNDWKCQMK